MKVRPLEAFYPLILNFVSLSYGRAIYYLSTDYHFSNGLGSLAS